MRIQFFFLFLPFLLNAQSVDGWSNNKKAVVATIDAKSKDLIRLSDEIWGHAETALREHRSAKALADYAEAQGFRVTRGVAGMPTAFVAEYGSGKPVIGILGEFDALPGLSQKTVPHKEALSEGAAGHGCGHNMFGPGSLGAAIAVKELIQNGQLSGTVRFYGTPAEESVGGKIYMVREGLFADLDACLDWHPDAETKASLQSSQALIDFSVEFKGRAAHAAYDPWNGRSAVDALELFLHGINQMREHVRPTVRIHYAITDGGDVPNVVSDHAKVWMWIRDSKRKGMYEVYEWAQKIAAGAAMMADVEHTVKINTGDYELLPNRNGGTALHQNLLLLGPIEYTAEEQAFARKIQEATGKPARGLDGAVKPLEETRKDPEGGSTDVGDVSWVVPQISLVVTTAPAETPWHSWPVVACGGMSIGHKGMLYASKALALTMVDLFEKESLRAAMRREFEEKKGGEVYKAMIPDGPPPVPR
jgi:aminobenzoyl-glutamate utilization protein B